MEKSRWTFLSNHGRVFVYIAKNPSTTQGTIAREVGLTLRGVQKIVSDLESAGYILRFREGRRNYYVVNPNLPMRHPLESNHSVGDILIALGCPQTTKGQPVTGKQLVQKYEEERSFVVLGLDKEGYLSYFY